jgi:UDP-3-O-[3-hydroxymyristoyl] N-acetylglucosamine deacetylase
MDAMVGDAIGSGYATKTCETPARAVQISGPSGNGGLVGGAVQQHTLKSSIHCMGVGLHSGRKVSLGLHPAAAGTGIIFRRTDLGIDIPARFDHVVDTRLCTVLADPAHPTARIGTVEHVMAALAGCGVSNALVTLDGPEAPILDGSAAGFTFLIDCAGLRAQHADAPVIEILRSVVVQEGESAAELHPGGTFPGLSATLSIDFAAAAIGSQEMSLDMTGENFRSMLAPARTFTQLHEVDQLRRAGLALGGSLDNAVVVDGEKVLNPGGLRMADEFVRHKLLDVVGDLALAGAVLHGRFIGHRSGHAMNNRLLRAVFAEPANWRLATEHDASTDDVPALSGRSGRQGNRMAIAAAPF